MLETYTGILRDSHIEWSGDAPAHLPSHQGIRVHVTLLDRIPAAGSENSQGERMAVALERLAVLAALEGITDPAVWERETRQDRPLPGRDD